MRPVILTFLVLALSGCYAGGSSMVRSFSDGFEEGYSGRYRPQKHCVTRKVWNQYYTDCY